MATIKCCDVCSGTAGVQITTIRFGAQRPLELDMCESCFADRFRDVKVAGRESRQRHTFRVLTQREYTL